MGIRRGFPKVQELARWPPLARSLLLDIGTRRYFVLSPIRDEIHPLVQDGFGIGELVVGVDAGRVDDEVRARREAGLLGMAVAGAAQHSRLGLPDLD
jgi:hypothetical protein